MDSSPNSLILVGSNVVTIASSFSAPSFVKNAGSSIVVTRPANLSGPSSAIANGSTAVAIPTAASVPSAARLSFSIVNAMSLALSPPISRN